MLGKSHAILGAAATTVALITTGTNLIEQPLVFIPAWMVGTLASLLPDIDSPNASIRTTFGLGRTQSWRELQRWRRKSFLAVTIDVIQWWLARLLDMLDELLPHRGPTHYGITCVLLTLGMVLICRTFNWDDAIWIAFGVGYFSHLMADGVTRAGVKLYGPLSKRAVYFVPRQWAVRTGSWQENFALYLMLSLLLIYFLFALGYLQVNLT